MHLGLPPLGDSEGDFKQPPPTPPTPLVMPLYICWKPLTEVYNIY